MDIDYDTEQSLFAAAESSSSEQMAMVMSERRLIRKPLPELPENQGEVTGGQSSILGRTGLPRQHAVSLERSKERAKKVSLEEQKQLDWWPSSSGRMKQTEPSEERKLGPYRLSSFYRQHLLKIIRTSLKARKRPSEDLATSIVDALHECLATISTLEALRALQQSYSFLWRVEAMLRSTEEADTLKASKAGGRWPQLPGWRNSISSGSQLTNTEARRRKRDIALQLLGSALRMNSGGIISQTDSQIDDQSNKTASSVATEEAMVKKPTGSIPQLLVKKSIPTVALHTNNDGDDMTFKPVEVESTEKSSVLTTRLAMQLKNSATIASERSPPKDEEAAITVCRVSLEYEEEGHSSRRRRSGTLTPGRARNASQMSTMSDQTIREQVVDSNVKIRWKANTFYGEALHLNPLSSEIQGRQPKQDSQLHFVGGTFVVESCEDDIELQIALRDTLNIGLYAACAMMMESSLLRDLNLEEEVVEDEEMSAIVKEDLAPVVPSTIPEIPESKPEKQSRWLWGMLHYNSSADQSNADVPDGSSESMSQPRKARKPFGYSSRLGKMINSLASGSGKRPLASMHSERQQDPDNEDKPEEVSQSPKGGEKEEAEKQRDLPALAISPFYHEEARKSAPHREQTEYETQLLLEERVSLTILDGLDLSLSNGRQRDRESVQRAPLMTRHSYPDSVKSNGSNASTASHIDSMRSTSHRPTAESITMPSSLDASSGDVGQGQKEVQFYQKEGKSRDISLGQAIEELVAKAKVLDEQAKQPVKKSKDGVEKEEVNVSPSRGHQLAQYLHGHDRISIMAHLYESKASHTSEKPQSQAEETQEATASEKSSDIIEQIVADSTVGPNEGQEITIWTANVKTGEETVVKVMSEATYVSSFGCFLKKLLSHPKLANDRYDVVRMIQLGNAVLKIQVQPILVFDLLVEGPIVCSIRNKENAKQSSQVKKDVKLIERTRVEIQEFFSSIKRHVSALEHVLIARELDDKGKTIKRPSLSNKSSINSLKSDDSSMNSTIRFEDTNGLYPSTGALKLLSKLKTAFREKEFGLYDDLKDTKADHINEVRMTFQSRAKSTKKRLSAWESKHLERKEAQNLAPLDTLEPDYFADKMYAFPGSRYLFREAEPLSIIAYTLSSQAFDFEVHRKEQKHAGVLDWRTSVLAPSTKSQLSVSEASTHSSLKSDLALDENNDSDTMEPLKVTTKRKKRAKEGGILSLKLKRANSEVTAQDQGSSAQSNGAETAHEQDENGTVTPTASQISSSTFDTSSSSNDTFRAHVAHLAPKTSLGSMFEEGTTAPPTLSEGSQFMSPNGSNLSRSIAREISESGTLLSVPGQDVLQRRAVSQPAASLHVDPKGAPLSPHIKHTIISGSLKVSCVSWFAEDFAKLREVWHIEDEFIESMSRCKSWHAMGGKSKSGFYVTQDGNWIAKQLLNIWRVDEKESFLDFAPAYLKYMMESAVNERPTLLVKIAGVFSIKIKDIKTGDVKLKMSVQILENVFAKDGGESIRFDVKGLKDRKVVQAKKEKGQNSREEDMESTVVWWDGEWLDCFQPRAFVPHDHKVVFQRALSNDMTFLTKLNVMDYSLLIGAQEHHSDEGKDDDAPAKPSFTVRIVDFLGSYTIAKAIESSSKRAMKGEAPTIIPPSEYAARFASSLKLYFIPT